MLLKRTVRTQAAPDRVFAYLSDFTTTNDWDPGTVRTERVSGDGGVGTTYHNVSRFLGRESELTYLVIEFDAPRHIALVGENETLTANDTIEVQSDGAGSQVTYTADFRFKGISRLVAPLLTPAFTKLGNDAERGMIEALDRLAGQ